MVAEDSRRDAATRRARLATAAVSDVPGPSGRSVPYPSGREAWHTHQTRLRPARGRLVSDESLWRKLEARGATMASVQQPRRPGWSRRPDRAASPRRRRAGGYRAFDRIATNSSTPGGASLGSLRVLRTAAPDRRDVIYRPSGRQYRYARRGGSREQMRILIVEDDARIRAFLFRAFEAEGFGVDVRRTASTAWPSRSPAATTS